MGQEFVLGVDSTSLVHILQKTSRAGYGDSQVVESGVQRDCWHQNLGKWMQIVWGSELVYESEYRTARG